MLDFIKKEPIEKGWSGDLKYRVTTADGSNYLLRITPHEKKKNRKGMFAMQQQVAALGVPMCQPLEYGVCEEGEYTLQSWIQGVDAEDLIPTLSPKAQYNYGVEADCTFIVFGGVCNEIHKSRYHCLCCTFHWRSDCGVARTGFSFPQRSEQ